MSLGAIRCILLYYVTPRSVFHLISFLFSSSVRSSHFFDSTAAAFIVVLATKLTPRRTSGLVRSIPGRGCRAGARPLYTFGIKKHTLARESGEKQTYDR